MQYLLCILIVGLIAVIADKKGNRLLVFLIALILSLFCGLRGASVGIDTLNYLNFLSYVRESEILIGSDKGFSAVSYVLMDYFDNPHYVLLICAFITNYLIIFRLWDFKGRASFPLMVLIFMVFHYPYTFNIVRQYFAISIIFWGTRYIERNQYARYIILNIIASTIHASSVLCFCILFITFGYENQKMKHRIIYFCLAISFIFIGLSVFYINVTKYEQYFEGFTENIHAMTILKTLCMLTIVFLNKLTVNSKFSILKSGDYVSVNREVNIIYQAGLALALLGMFYPFMNRIGFYFMMYEMPFWGQSVRTVKNDAICKLMIVSILIYTVVMTLLYDTSGLVKYTTFLEDKYL